MNLDINQENLYMIIPSTIAWLADYLSEDKGISVSESLKEIYLSDTYKKLEIESTKMWHLGPVALYQDLMHK